VLADVWEPLTKEEDDRYDERIDWLVDVDIAAWVDDETRPREVLEDRLEDDFEFEERFEEELLERMEDNNDDSDDSAGDDAEENADVWDTDIVDKVEVSVVLDVRDGTGAYVNTTAGEAVVVVTDTGGQDVVDGCGEAATAELKLWEEGELIGETDINMEDAAMVVVLDCAGIIVAPHVHTDAHVQTDEHVHENIDACVQDTAVASESDGTAPGGNERIRGDVDDCEEDIVENCHEVDVNVSEDDDRDVEEHVVDEDDESCSIDDDEDNTGGNTKDVDNDWDVDTVACVVICTDGGVGGCPLGDAPDIAFLIMSAAWLMVSICEARVALAILTLSATPYTTACRWLAGMTGMIDASTSLKFWVPYTSSCGSTTPPRSRGSMAQVPLGWNSVCTLALMKSNISWSVAFGLGLSCSGCSSFIGAVASTWRLYTIEASKTSRSTGFEPYRGSMIGGSNGRDEINWKNVSDVHWTESEYAACLDSTTRERSHVHIWERAVVEVQ
jgi:hypothetical protein